MERSEYPTKSRVLGTNTDNQHIEGNLSVGDIALDFRIIADVNDTLLIIDLSSFGFKEFDGGLLLTENVANGLHDRAVLDQTGGT